MAVGLTSALDPPGRLPPLSATGQDIQHLPDRLLAIREVWQSKVCLYLVAIAATLPHLDDVPGVGEVSDDGVRVALGDTEIPAISRRRTSGSCAMQSRVRPWLVRKLQLDICVS